MSYKPVIAVLIAALVLVGGALVVMNLGGGEPKEEGTYSDITYVLNGGTADPSSPSRYHEGEVTELGCPTKFMGSGEEYLFMGWYLDSACTQNLMYIPADMTGDITVYALWSEDVVGFGFQFDTVTKNIQSWFGQKMVTESYGTFSYTYLYYDEDDGYLQKRVTGTMQKDGSMTYRETVEWQSAEEQVEEVSHESDVIIEIGDWKPKTEVYTVSLYGGAYVEKQYFIYGWMLIKMESTAMGAFATEESEYTFTKLLRSESRPTYTVTAYADKGLTVEGAGPIDAYSKNVQLTVSADEGTEFAGWYDENGRCLSKSAVYTLDLILSDVAVYALNTDDTDYTAQKGVQFSLETEVPLTETRWTVLDESGKEISDFVADSFVYTFDDCGIYDVLYSGKDGDGNTVSKIGSVIVNGTVAKTYSWSYGEETFTATLNIKYSDYYAYKSDPISREQGKAAHDLMFVTYEDSYILSLANQISKQTASMSTEDRISVLLRFTQTIPYVTDAESRGLSEYFKFPLETLYDYGGDCEDTTFLFCAIGKAMGYDVAILYFQGHAAAGINMSILGYDKDNVGKETIRQYFYQWEYDVLTVNGKTVTYLYGYQSGGKTSAYYLFCETTTVTDSEGKEFNIGDVPLYDSYSAYDNPYSSLRKESVIPVV